MSEQQKISNDILKNKIGKKCEVLIEETSFDNKFYIGRTMQDVPEIDGLVYIKNDGQENILNTFVKCEVIDVKNYDLIAKIV